MSSTDPLRAARNLIGDRGAQVLAAACDAAGAALVTSTLRSVHHRPGRSVSHVYEVVLHAAGADREVLLVSHVDSRDLPEGAFVLEQGPDRVAVWRFPQDPYLPGLPSAISPGRVRELLDRLGAPAGDVSLHTRAYRPSRRAVVEVRIGGEDTEGRILYLKVLAGDRAQEVADVHRQLVAHVPVPRLVGVAGAQGIVALEALPGRTLRDAVVAGTALPDGAALVELTERFAASGLTSRRDPRAFADPVRHVDGLVRLLPDRADEIAAIARAAAAVQGEVVAVHGDLHDGQLLLADDGTLLGLLDVDGSGPGLVAHDAGNLVAHVAVLGEIWPTVADRATAYAASLAAAFRTVVGAEALARATAGAWIGLATGPYRAQDADWRERTDARIDAAAAALG